MAQTIYQALKKLQKKYKNRRWFKPEEIEEELSVPFAQALKRSLKANARRRRFIVAGDNNNNMRFRLIDVDSILQESDALRTRIEDSFWNAYNKYGIHGLRKARIVYESWLKLEPAQLIELLTDEDYSSFKRH